MAYNPDNLICLHQHGGAVGFREWLYDSVDITTDFDTAGYISDARARGMRKGDKITHRIWTTAVPTEDAQLLSADGSDNDLVAVGSHFVIGISAAGAADLPAVTAMTVTNSD